MTNEERAYNSEEFAATASTPTNPGETMAAKVGVAAPDFEASNLDGAVIRLSDFRGKQHVVMMTGAVTSPMCAFEVPAFNQLQTEFDGIQLPILVDHLDGRIHRAYGVWPNALFVIHKDGGLIFRSNMANHAELRQFLDDLLAAEKAAGEGRVTHLQYSERVVPHEADQATHRRVYERAGPKAFEDYWAKRPQNRNRWP